MRRGRCARRGACGAAGRGPGAQVGGHERVECRRRGRRLQARGDRGQLGVERLADDRRALDQRARLVRQRGDLEADRRQQRRRQRAVAAVGDARELVQVERDPARLAHDALAHRRVRHARDELERRLDGRAARARAAPTRARCARRRAGGRPGRPVARRSPAARERRRAGARGAGRARARPRRPSAGRPAAPRPARAPPAVTRPRGGAGSAPRPALHRARPRSSPSASTISPNGHVALVLRAAPGDDLQARRACALADLRQQGALAQPRPAQQPEHPARTAAYVSDRASGAGQLQIAPQQLHAWSRRTLRRPYSRGVERGRSPWNAEPGLGVSTRT